MNDHDPKPSDLPLAVTLTRRQASQIIAGATLLGLSGFAIGQPPSNRPKTQTPPAKPGNNPSSSAPSSTQPADGKPPEPKSFLDGVITKRRSRDWILKPNIHIQSYQEDPGRVPKDGSRTITIKPIDFKSAAIVFPIIRGCASSETADVENIKSEVTFDDKPVDVKPEFNEAYHSMVRLGRWEMTDKAGRECELKLEIPMTCWQTELDEKLALKAEWPKDGKWGRVGQSTLAPQAMIDQPSGDPAALNDAEALQKLIKTWLGDKLPQAMPPMMLAKFFAGKVVEQFQKSGNGERYNKIGTFAGLELQGPARTIQLGTGSPHDLASLLLGTYRAAGLPSRLVIGYDESGRKGDDSSLVKVNRSGIQIRSWVEFGLYDPEVRKEFWVPVDVVEIRSRSSRPGPLDKPWKYFGTHDQLDALLPFAFHYIPPTTVIAYGYAFWGWLTMPTTQVADNWVRFNAQVAPKRYVPPGSQQPGKGKKPS